MTITRNGQEYELTFSELMDAASEYKLDGMISSIKGLCENMDNVPKLTEEDFETIARDAVHNLGKNDSYSEAYWETAKQTLSTYLEGEQVTLN